MKKTINILFCLLYLASSVGYASIEHYCHAMHQQSAHSGGRWCALSCCGETATLPAGMSTHCCVADAPAEQKEKADEALNSAKCCENISSYHQIDDSSTRESNPNIISVGDEAVIFLSPDLDNWTIYRPTNLLTDPSFQLNLPLLN
ncbi:hypothetical protein EH223_01325 [candidate division KSB1 bacterium]|nr:hypothetical protein [candidate division KSB1 bacterium]RQW06842.1 MAG: hypothetical protein EH223_01325 [candidate division KSB1 bacterium]